MLELVLDYSVHKFFLVLFIFFLLYNILYHHRTRVPIVITPKKYIKYLFSRKDVLNINSDMVVYELGSAWGYFSFEAARRGAKKIIGFELSVVHCYYAKLKAWLTGSRAEFYVRDFFKEDLSRANIVYVFLVPGVVSQVWQKMKKECRPGTVMVLLGHELDEEQFYAKIKTNPKKEKSTHFYFYKI